MAVNAQLRAIGFMRYCFVFLPLLFCCGLILQLSDLMELSSYERDFKNAKALKTLLENTDPEHLVQATKRKIEQAERHSAPDSPNRPPVGALTIAQV